MKRFASIFFSIAILISSGLVQFVVHICPEQGAMMSAEECEMHQARKAMSCCQSIHTEEADDCCDEASFFGVSPKFGSIAPEKLAPCAMEYLQTPQFIFTAQQERAENAFPSVHIGKPPLHNRMLLQSYCTFLI